MACLWRRGSNTKQNTGTHTTTVCLPDRGSSATPVFSRRHGCRGLSQCAATIARTNGPGALFQTGNLHFDNKDRVLRSDKQVLPLGPRKGDIRGPPFWNGDVFQFLSIAIENCYPLAG